MKEITKFCSKAVILLSIFTLLSLSASAGDIPKSLFGIEIGKTYDLSTNNIGDLPVKHFRGFRKFMGEGVSYFFEPLKNNKEFVYIEKKKDTDEIFFETSHRLYLLPVPFEGENGELKIDNTSRFEVTLVEWNSEKSTDKEAYFWAFRMCEMFAIDIDVKPIISDDYEKSYECLFPGKNTWLSIEARGRISLSLTDHPDNTNEKSENLRKLRLKIDFNDIKPF